MKPTLSPFATLELNELAKTYLGIPSLQVLEEKSVVTLSAKQLQEALETAYISGMVDHLKRRSE